MYVTRGSALLYSEVIDYSQKKKKQNNRNKNNTNTPLKLACDCGVLQTVYMTAAVKNEQKRGLRLRQVSSISAIKL